jgi:hypothetical protein
LLTDTGSQLATTAEEKVGLVSNLLKGFGTGVPLPFPSEEQKVMQIELRCPRCPCRFSAAPETPADQVVDLMIEEGPWFALARGETFEDMIFAALVARGKIRCPECGVAVAIHEESLGRLTRERLAAVN